MASEIVSPTQEPALEAFQAYDSSIFLGWVEAIGDMMLAGSKPEHLGPSTLPSIGGLVYALSRAAQELSDRERQEIVERQERLAQQDEEKVRREQERLDRMLQEAMIEVRKLPRKD